MLIIAYQEHQPSLRYSDFVDSGKVYIYSPILCPCNSVPPSLRREVHATDSAAAENMCVHLRPRVELPYERTFAESESGHLLLIHTLVT